jgi:hypothetical protein
MSQNTGGYKLLRLPPSLSFVILALSVLHAVPVYPLESSPAPSTSLYEELRNFSLGYSSVRAEHLVLKKDRATITFESGTFYFPAPVAGKVRGAVFLGDGLFHADVPPSEFEKENVRRLLKADEVDSNFKSAVLRFTDDTYSDLGAGSPAETQAPEQATRLAEQLDGRVLEETGANLSARQMVSIVNHEPSGFFFIQVDGGHRGRFNFLLDYQARIPVANFEINAGERGLIYAFDQSIGGPDVWMAFHTQADYQRGQSAYSDEDDLITASKYTMNVDVTEPKKWLKLSARIECESRFDGLIAIPFVVGEDLAQRDDERRKKQLHVASVRSDDGSPLHWFQEPWEGGFTVILPSAMGKNHSFTLEIALSGEFMFESQTVGETYFPLRTTTWFPRHGYLQRSVFVVQFQHRKRDTVASVGTIIRDEEIPGFKDRRVTEFRLDHAIALISFGVGSYEIHKDFAKMENGTSLPVEFYSMPGRVAAIKEDFILAELNNCVRYFSVLFGDYPYPVFRGAFHPFGYGQGFPTTLMIPGADRATMYTYQFIAHETAHQWWGDSVLWRSYRDQWLSEGFAEYSGLLYTQMRDRTSSEHELIERARRSLSLPPATLSGVGKGHLADVGPLVMGHRLNTRETGGAYTALIYSKGALVLRMLHFLFTDPQTGDGKPFFNMMRDFVRQYANHTASTDDFFAVVNAHVGETALARKYGYKNLNWFYRQWVLQAYLPSYRFTYALEDQSDGSVLLSGNLLQDGVPDSEQWFMPLPLTVTLSKGSQGIIPVAVRGKESPIKVRLPSRPQKIELDPQLWILSEKTSAERR